jgi:hypothetical protein
VHRPNASYEANDLSSFRRRSKRSAEPEPNEENTNENEDGTTVNENGEEVPANGNTTETKTWSPFPGIAINKKTENPG